MIKKQVLVLLISILFSFATSADDLDNYSNYCMQSGGKVEKMIAEYDTDRGQVQGESKNFCIFTPDNGILAIGLEAFSSEKPNIAATYMKTLPEITDKSPLWEGSQSNPSQNVCKNLGGASIGFVTGGGFANQLGKSDICVFGDGSMVSAWSLIYMANHRTGYDDVKHKVNSEPLSIYVH